MSDLEAQVGAILEKMVNATVKEMTKITGVDNPNAPEVSTCAAESPRGPSADTVR